MEQPIEEKFRKAITGVINEPVLASLLVLLSYLLYYYVGFLPLHLILIFLLAVESPVAVSSVIFGICFVCIFSASSLMPVPPLVIPVPEMVAPDIELIYQIYGILVNHTVLQVGEFGVVYTAGLVFGRYRDLSLMFETVSVGMVLLLVLVLDSDGLFLFREQIAAVNLPAALNLGKQLPGQLIDIAIVKSLHNVCILLSIVLWAGCRLSAWLHSAYKVYARMASNMRLSHPFAALLLLVLLFDRQWLIVMTLPLYLCFLSLAVFFFEAQNFRRPEAILIAMFITFMVELYVPGFWIFVLSIVMADCAFNVRRFIRPVNMKKL